MALPASDLMAQEQGEPPVLPPIEVRVTRDRGRSPLELPFAVSTTIPDSARPGQRHLSLDETLLLLPGVLVANRNNPTQDPRISIRGFGARSAFGVRGVRVMRDGMPLTLPDGQTPVDYLDLESVGRVEVLRGSASALYGNAAGGVIELRSADPPRDPFAATVRGWDGKHGQQRWVGSAGGTVDPVRYQATLSRTSGDGWRDHSLQRTTHGHARVATEAGGTALALQALVFDMPVAQNPGALTAAELHDPRTADPASVRRRARKAVSQMQVGLTATRGSAERELLAAVYGGTRALDNPLPFAIVDIDRASYGGSARGTMSIALAGVDHRLSAGADVQLQADDRRNFANCNDAPAPAPATALPGCAAATSERGEIRLDQRERVSSVGVFVRDELRLGSRWLLSAGVRADRVRFRVEDRLVGGTNPDDSGERTLAAVSPMVGALLRLGLLTAAYVNVSTAFETPTATELGNKPDGSAGINPELDPQRAVSAEVGLKGTWLGTLRYDLALFQTRVSDELVVFEVPGGAGRRYFRNAGRTMRRGGEISAGITSGPLDIGAAYSFAHYRFRDYTALGVDYAGKAIPGVPRHQLQGSATVRHAGAWLTTEVIAAGALPVNDANTESAPAYEVLHLRAGGSAIFGKPWLSPVVGVQNVLDRRYVAAVNINATGGRFYEPANGRTAYVGLTLGYGR